MGCFTIPKNKSKVAAASQQAEQQQLNYHYGSKLEQLLSSNKPVLLPDPDDLPGEQPQGTGPISTPTSIRGGKQQLSGGKERGGIAIVTTTGSNNNSSSRLINHHPRALSAPVNYPSFPPGEDRQCRPVAHSGNIATSPFSAPLSCRPPLDGISSPAPISPPTAANYGSPLHSIIAGAGVSDVINRGSQQGLDKRVTKAFIEKKSGLFYGKPVRLPLPQATAAHPLPLPHPPDLDELAVVGMAAGVTTGLGLSSSVSPSPSRGKDGFGLTNYGFRSMGGNPVEPLPLPPPALPTHSRTPVRAFPYGELSHAFLPECFIGDGVFGRAYRAWVEDHGENSSKKKVEVAVVCPVKALQGPREWMAEVNWLARLQDPHLCKLIGYCVEDVPGLGTRRLLVYEFMNNGSLDNFVAGKEGSRVLDWSTRVRVALDIAQGLTYLHDKAPFQVICRDLSSLSIQLDKDLRAKLSGFGLARCGPEGDQGLLMAGPYVAPESGRNGLVTIKSNAWSFGVVLLELLTGRKHMDPSFPSGQQNLVQLTKPFLRDEGKLFLIMDPDLNGRYSGRGALKVANLAFQCLIKEASLRPNLSEAVDVLRTVQTDEESLAGDLKKSRSLTQSVGSPVTYSRSTSDHFIQRSFNSNSLTSSPASDPKQRDREHLKLAASGSATSSPSYMESRLFTDLKQPKSIFGDRDAQKLPMPAQQPFESRLQHLDNQQRERDPQKLATAHFIETITSLELLNETKQRGLRKMASYGTVVSSAPFSSDSKRPSSPAQLQGRGEVKILQPLNLTGLVSYNEIKQESLEPQLLSTRSQSQEALMQSTEARPQGREAKKVKTPQTIGTIQNSEFKQQRPEAQKLPAAAFSSSLLPSNAELKQLSSEGTKLLTPQSAQSGELKRSSDLKQRYSESHGSLMSLSFSFPLPGSGELSQQDTEATAPVPMPLSGDSRQEHPNARKLQAVSPLINSTEHAGDMRLRDPDVQKLLIQTKSPDGHEHLHQMKLEEQEILKSSSARSSASSRSSCAPALTFEPPMIREEFCVW